MFFFDFLYYMYVDNNSVIAMIYSCQREVDHLSIGVAVAVYIRINTIWMLPENMYLVALVRKQIESVMKYGNHKADTKLEDSMTIWLAIKIRKQPFNSLVSLELHREETVMAK